MNEKATPEDLASAAAIAANEKAKSNDPTAGMDLSKVKRPRDPRLDFFRGIAMFIILIAHTSWNSWTCLLYTSPSPRD